jgi:hypothetical protein
MKPRTEMPDREKTSKPNFAGKMMAALMPPVVFTALARGHIKVAELIGLLVGAIAWYLCPPRSSLRSLSFVLLACVILGLINLLI